MAKENKGNNNLFVKVMAGILAGLMLFSLCITPIAWLVSYFSK